MFSYFERSKSSFLRFYGGILAATGSTGSETKCHWSVGLCATVSGEQLTFQVITWSTISTGASFIELSIAARDNKIISGSHREKRATSETFCVE